MVKREHLVGEVADDQAGMAGAIVVASIDAHARAGNAIFAEGDAGSDAAFSSNVPFVLVQIKLVGLGVVGEQNVGPAVAVVIENRDAQALRGVDRQSPAFCGRVFELAVAQVVPQPRATFLCTIPACSTTCARHRACR